jgi:hypothetical protein
MLPEIYRFEWDAEMMRLLCSAMAYYGCNAAKIQQYPLFTYFETKHLEYMMQKVLVQTSLADVRDSHIHAYRLASFNNGMRLLMECFKQRQWVHSKTDRFVNCHDYNYQMLNQKDGLKNRTQFIIDNFTVDQQYFDVCRLHLEQTLELE